MSLSVNLSDLGRRVRAIRLARRMTLDDVVSQTDFTVSWLSKLENGQLSPSLDGLVRIAEVLQCGVDSLVQGLSVPPQYVVVRSGSGRIDPSHSLKNGIRAESLADQWRNRSMDPLILHVSGNGNRKRPDNHDGERLLFVLDGDVKVSYGDDQILLGPGDSIYIYAAIPHTIVPAGKGTARVLSVSYDSQHAGQATPRLAGGDATPSTRRPGGRKRPPKGGPARD